MPVERLLIECLKKKKKFKHVSKVCVKKFFKHVSKVCVKKFFKHVSKVCVKILFKVYCQRSA